MTTSPASGSTPSFSEFNPYLIPWQGQLVEDIFEKFDYRLGVHEILLSGALGAGKSLPAAHCALRHLMTYPKSRCILGRRSLSDLRDTIYTKIIEHLDGTVKSDGTIFREGRDYYTSRHHCRIAFANGSELISRSWGDGLHKKMGSLEASCAIVEEASENNADDELAIRYLRMRIGRLPHVPQQWIIYVTNPDSPSHFLFKYFQIGERQRA